MATAAAKAYLEGLAQEFGLNDDEKAALLKVTEKEAVAKRLVDDHKRQSDYSRAMDEVRSKTLELEGRSKEWTDWYNNAVTNDQARERELQDLRTRTGTNGTTTTGTTVTSGLTEAQVQKMLQEQGSRLVSVTKQAMKIASRHAAEFHEALDVDAVEKIAIANNMTVEDAYNRWIAPRLEERAKADVDARIKAAHDDGLKEGMSKASVPDETTRGHHVFFDRQTEAKPVGDRARLSSFVESWQEAARSGVNK